MKKHLMILVTVLALSLALFACSSPNEGALKTSVESDLSTGQSTRKIVYTFDANLETSDINQTIQTINDALEQCVDSYIQESNVQTDNAYIKIRVRVEDYSDLISQIPNAGEILSSSSTATDVTSTYLTLQATKTSLQNQLDRLNELYSQASVYEIIQIASQIRSVEQELLNIDTQIQNYDSLTSLCTVNLNITLKGSSNTQDVLVDAISWVWGGVGNIFLVFVIIFPFGAVATGIFFLTRFIIKKTKKS